MAKRKDWLDRVFDLHALLGSSFEAERGEALVQLIKLLTSKRKTWNAHLELLEIVRKRRAPPAPPTAPAPPPPTGDPLSGRDLFNGIRAVLQDFLSLNDDEYVACTLWAMHTHVCRRFMHTPRLVLSSGVRGCVSIGAQKGPWIGKEKGPASALEEACPGSEREGPVCPPGQAGAVRRLRRGF